MNQKAKYIDVLKGKIKETDIRQVAALRYDLVKQGNNHKMLCPFHHDTSVGSFVVGGRHNTYHCFTCGEHGDAITLIQRADGTGFVDAIITTAVELGFITSEQGDNLTGDDQAPFNLSEISSGDFRPFEATDTPASNLAEADVLHNVFTTFSKGNTLIGEKRLSDDHMAHLKDVRGISEKEIDRVGFFTMPNPAILKEFFDELYLEYGYLPHILEEVPGFYSAESWKVDTKNAGLAFADVMEELSMQLFDKQEGIGIPIRDAQERIVGIQVRADKGTLRYKWFSSSNVDKDKGKTNGTSSGAPKDVVYPTQLRNTTLFITEGKFKALSLAEQFGSIVISIQGVSAWRGVEELIAEVEEVKELSFNHVVIAYDADLAYNDAVAKQTLNLGEALHEKTNASVHVAVWDDNCGKGIDDLIKNGNICQLRRLTFDTFKGQVDRMLETAFETKDEAKKYFIQYILKPVAKKS